MTKKILFIFVNLSFALNLACSKIEVPNSNANKSLVTNTSPANLPAGLSANQISPGAESAPGIPDPKSANTNGNSKSTASIPGIPDTTKMGKTPQPKNTPPIPGIPDEETLKKQMNTPVNKSIMDRKPPEFESNSGKRPSDKRKAGSKPGTNK